MAEPNPANPPQGLKKPIPRRDFVKKSMIAASAGAAIAFGAPSVVPLSYNPRKIPRFKYLGARILPPGPAPQGIPLIPVRVVNGVVEGVPENREASVDHHLGWYKYCSHEMAPGLEPGFTQDNRLRYYTNPEKIRTAQLAGIPLWYENLMDQEMRAEHFKNVGDGAPFRWRSEGQEGTNIVTGILIKVELEKIKSSKPLTGFTYDNGDGTGFIAYCSFCAHFCCVPGYAENKNPLARPEGRETIYCSCHDSRYDPLDVREYTFPPDF